MCARRPPSGIVVLSSLAAGSLAGIRLRGQSLGSFQQAFPQFGAPGRKSKRSRLPRGGAKLVAAEWAGHAIRTPIFEAGFSFSSETVDAVTTTGTARGQIQRQRERSARSSRP